MIARQREPGGGKLDVPQLFQETLQDMTENISGYLQVGLALFAVAVPVGMFIAVVGIIVLYGVMIVGMMGSIGAGAALGESMGDRDIGGLVSMFGSFGSMFCAFIGFFGIVAAGTAAIAPISASITRTIAAHQRGEGEMTFQGAFATIKQDVAANIGVIFLVMASTLVGVMFCYIGALVPAFLFTFATPMVALGRLGAMAALSRAGKDAMGRPVEHVTYVGAYFLCALVANYVPVLGHAFMLALQIRAYRKLYGDAELAA